MRSKGISNQVKIEKADFMKLPVRGQLLRCRVRDQRLRVTHHDRKGVYSEIRRVLKPGGIFATYEWCLTDKYDANDAYHRKIKKDIEVGDGLPDMCHTSVCTKALEKEWIQHS